MVQKMHPENQMNREVTTFNEKKWQMIKKNVLTFDYFVF